MDFSNIHEIELSNKKEIFLLSYKDFDVNNYLSILNKKDFLKWENISHPSRQREFIATRLLKNQVLSDSAILYDEVGAPYTEDGGFISISHSNNMIGLASAPFKLGMDLEPVSGKAKKLYKKFLNEEEISLFDTESEREMTKAWSAKETLYKLAGRKKIIFKEELLLTKITSNSFKGTVVQPDGYLHCEIQILESEYNILTINHGQCEFENK
ncbi:MAG: 4'-phosphopantetheinyl transferase [Psychromonas sp.]|jgi:4'-phosphopantetheinyl transferase